MAGQGVPRLDAKSVSTSLPSSAVRQAVPATRQTPADVKACAQGEVSMPGMMDTILNLGLNDVAVEGLATSTGNPRFALDSYRRLIQMYGEVVDGVDGQRFEQALTDLKAARGVAQDVDLAPDDLRELVATFATIYEEERLLSEPRAIARVRAVRLVGRRGRVWRREIPTTRHCRQRRSDGVRNGASSGAVCVSRGVTGDRRRGGSSSQCPGWDVPWHAHAEPIERSACRRGVRSLSHLDRSRLTTATCDIEFVEEDAPVRPRQAHRDCRAARRRDGREAHLAGGGRGPYRPTAPVLIR
jgi:hypothetical protein